MGGKHVPTRRQHNERIDLGHEHYLTFVRWAPDDLPENRKRYGVPLPRVERAGATVYHPHKKRPGQTCIAGISFDLPELARAFQAREKWAVVSWEPLTLRPSLLCMECGDHGFIENGQWRPA